MLKLIKEFTGFLIVKLKGHIKNESRGLAVGDMLLHSWGPESEGCRTLISSRGEYNKRDDLQGVS